MNPNPTIEQALAECENPSRLANLVGHSILEGRLQFARDLLERYIAGDYARSAVFFIHHGKEDTYHALIVDTVKFHRDGSCERIAPGYALTGIRCGFLLYGLFEEVTGHEEKQLIGDYATFELACAVASRLGGVR
jgi:hypothetical protein